MDQDPKLKDPKNKKKKTEDVADVELDVEEGDTGTVISSGLLSQTDYNNDLTGTKRIRKYDEMKLGDATVRAALNIVKLPITSSSWYIKPVDEKNPEEVRIKDFVTNQLLMNPSFSWMQLLKQVLTFCDYGNSVFEKVFEIITEGEFAGYIGWKKFGHRMSKTIQRWTMNDGKTEGIVQLLPAGKMDDRNLQVKTMAEIPRWKLLYFILDMEGTNYEGISLLRSAYKHWYMKDTYYKIDAIASERQGLGFPIIKSPAQAKPDDKRKAREIAKNMRANSQAYADLPMGFTIEMLDMKANSIKDVKEMVLHHDRQIMKSVLGTFMELGSQGGSGSYNLSEVLVNFFYLSEEYFARLIVEEFQKAINELIDLNFGKRKQYPTLEHGDFTAVNIEQMANALKSLSDANLIIPDDGIERKMRKIMHLPEIDAELKGRDELRQKQMEQKLVTPDTQSNVNDKKVDTDKDKKGNPDKKVKASEPDDFMEFAEDMLSEVRETIYAKESAQS